MSDLSYPRHRGLFPAVQTQPTRNDANPGGDIFGGWILSQMDLAGGAFAFAYAGSRVVTAGIDAMSFLRPVFVGERIEFFVSLEKVGRSSIAVRIETWSIAPASDEARKVTEGLFTYVAIDANHQPRPVRPEHAA